MYEIKKKDLMYGYVAYFFKYSSNILVLPFIVKNLLSSEYAVWNIFLAFNTFIILFDLGYGVVIQRYVMYAYSGAKEISSGGMPQIVEGKQPNYKLLYQIMITSSKIYSRIAKLSAILLIFLTPYILYISNAEFEVFYILISWGIFSLSVVISMYTLSEATIIKGLGMIGELQKITLINSIFSTVIKIVLLEFGLGILGLSVSFFTTSILLFYQYFRITTTFINRDLNLYKMLKRNYEKEFSESFKIIKEKSRGIGGVLVSNFIQNQMFTIIAPIFISLKTMGMYGLTWQVVNVVASLSSITFSSYIMRMGNFMVSNRKKELKETFSITIFIFLILYFIGSLIILIFGNQMLGLIESNTSLLPIQQIFLIIIYTFMIQINQKATNILSLSNNQKYVKSLIISSVLIATINVFLLYNGFGITEVLLSGIIIYSVYNLWKWPYEAMKLCSVKISDFYTLSYNKFKTYI